jgi:hypothetical protein
MEDSSSAGVQPSAEFALVQADENLSSDEVPPAEGQYVLPAEPEIPLSSQLEPPAQVPVSPVPATPVPATPVSRFVTKLPLFIGYILTLFILLQNPICQGENVQGPSYDSTEI